MQKKHRQVQAIILNCLPKIKQKLFATLNVKKDSKIQDIQSIFGGLFFIDLKSIRTKKCRI